MATNSICFTLLLATLVAVGGCASPQVQQQSKASAEQAKAPPASLQAAVANAESWGRALYESYRTNAPAGDSNVKTAIETARASVRDDCAPTYRTVVVNAPGAPADRLVLYHMAVAAPSQGAMLGRHYRIETSADGKAVLLGEPSTTACLTLPPASDPAEQAFINHPLSPAPNEFHVFFSLQYGRALLVVTGVGSWRVENGKILYLGRT